MIRFNIYLGNGNIFFNNIVNNLRVGPIYEPDISTYLFYGIVKSCTKCLKCKNILYNFQYFQFLSFPLFNYQNKEFNIYRGFKEYIKNEKLIGNNQCYCQKCKDLNDASVSSIIYYTPPYLFINLDYGKNKKYIPKKIEFGEIIDITGFVDKDCKDITYQLIAVATHIGSSGNSGHYIAYCKDNKNKKDWHYFSDSYHTKCEFNDIKKNTPYLLLFKRINNVTQ